jgi:hypothetical protein
LNSPLLEQTRKLVLASLDFIEAQNLKLLEAGRGGQVALVEGSGTGLGLINFDSDLLQGEGFMRSQGRDVVLTTSPMVAALVCKTEFKELECHLEVGTAPYPSKEIKEDKGVREAEKEEIEGGKEVNDKEKKGEKEVEDMKVKLSDIKLVDTSISESNYPTDIVVHPLLEGKDWCLLEEGSPAFITTDGLGTVLPFVRPVTSSGHFSPPGKG